MQRPFEDIKEDIVNGLGDHHYPQEYLDVLEACDAFTKIALCEEGLTIFETACLFTASDIWSQSIIRRAFLEAKKEGTGWLEKFKELSRDKIHTFKMLKSDLPQDYEDKDVHTKFDEMETVIEDIGDLLKGGA